MRTPRTSPTGGLLAVALSTALLLGATSGLAGPASAAPAAPGAAPRVAQYGPRCTVTLSATVVRQGTRLVVTVRCDGVTRRFTVVIRSTVSTTLPAVPPDAGGVSTFPVDTSALAAGAYTVVVTFDDGSTQVLPFTVAAAALAAPVPVAPPSGGGLVFTGASAVVPLTVLGAVLVLGGAGAVVAGRRRDDHPA